MKISVKGTIVPDDDTAIYDFFGIENVCPKKVNTALDEANGEDVDVYINSGGGDVISANEIYSALRDYSGNVHIHITGLAASAATIIMCAADCDISPPSMVMIHNVSSCCEGNYRDMQKQGRTLRDVEKAICKAYTEKTGMSESKLLAMMDEETWLNSEEAVKLGFCDRIASTKEAFVNSYCTILSDGQRKEYENAKNKLKAKLKLLEVKVR